MSFGLTTAQAVMLAMGAGAATSLYGANKQDKAIKAAASQDRQSQADQNAAAWANYLMTRGINPAGAVTGQIPTNPQAINARLPLWATGAFKTGGTQGWRKKGQGAAPLPIAAPQLSPPQYYAGGGDTLFP